jgi:hypothetical protein
MAEVLNDLRSSLLPGHQPRRGDAESLLALPQPSGSAKSAPLPAPATVLQGAIGVSSTTVSGPLSIFTTIAT